MRRERKWQMLLSPLTPRMRKEIRPMIKFKIWSPKLKEKPVNLRMILRIFRNWWRSIRRSFILSGLTRKKISRTRSMLMMLTKKKELCKERWSILIYKQMSNSFKAYSKTKQAPKWIVNNFKNTKKTSLRSKQPPMSSRAKNLSKISKSEKNATLNFLNT